MPTVEDALNIINKLTPKEQKDLKSMLLNDLTFIKDDNKNMEDFMTEKRFSKGHICPLCGSYHI